MAFDAGELFVKVRPDTTGFSAEAEGSVAKAGRDLSKVFLAAFAVGGAVEAIKSVVEAATKQQAAFAVLDRVLKNAGLSAEGFSASLKDKLEVQARATGVSAEDLAAAMDRLVPATRNSEKSLKDLNTAIGISETYHISLSTAALALAKTETGSFNSLQRYLGAIPRVTTNVDALNAKYHALTASYGTQDAATKAAYASALKQAQAQDKLLTSQNALQLATEKFGGVAQTFANTYAGQFARLHVNVDQLKVAVGTELVGGLASAASGVNDFLSKLLASDKVQGEARATAHDLGVAFHEVGGFLKEVGPPLVSVTDALGGFVRVGEIAAAVFVGYKLSLIGSASAEEVAAAGTVSLTGALTANTAALVANTAALTGDAAAVTELGAAAGTAAAGGVSLLTRGVGLLKKGLLEYLIVNQAIKALQPDTGLDFSNNTAKFVKGDNGSPYQKGSEDDLYYQAGVAGQKGPVLKLGGGGTARIAALAKDSLKAYQDGLKSAVTQAATTSGGAGSFVSGFLGPITGIQSQIDQAIAAGKAANTTAIQGLRTSIATDKDDLKRLAADMADAVLQGPRTIAAAVEQAKQNLNTIGQSLASTLAATLDKPLNDEAQRISDAQDKIASRFDRTSAYLNSLGSKLSRQQAELSLTGAKQAVANLRTSVHLPGGKALSADPKEALAQLERLQKSSGGSPALAQYIAQYQSAVLTVRQGEVGLRVSATDARRQALETSLQLKGDALKLNQDLATHEKAAAARRIANVTDEFNRHEITYAKLHRRVTNILVAAGVDRKKVVAALGSAAGNQFADEQAGLGAQASALLAGPQQPGSGLIPSIVRPLDSVNQVQKQIRDLATQQRAKQLDETKKHTELLKKIHGAQAGSKFRSSVDKNPGGANKRHAKLTGVGPN